jgi:hypothetical protein
MLIVFAVGSLVCCWVWGDTSLRTNAILTAVYVGSWGLLCLPQPFNISSVALAQALFAIVIGMMTFGVDWIMRHAWHLR